jgi:anti-sigma regulatory factor (Ser/Thr protein kinase)
MGSSSGATSRSTRAAARLADFPLADGVYRALMDETPLEDDVALLAIETMPLESTLEMTLPARSSVLGGLRRTVDRWLQAAGATEDDQFDITLSVSEAAANAIQHAYGANEATFTVGCEQQDRQVTVTVRDAGRWRTSSPPGGGRGLEIMHALVDSVEVSSDDAGTVVTMTKRLSRE